MANGIRIGNPRGFNKGRGSKFCEGSRVQQTPEEGRRTYRPKRCGNINKDEDNSPKILNDKNHQASSQKFTQQTDEEGWRAYRPKRCGNNNKDEDNSPKTLNHKNQSVKNKRKRSERKVPRPCQRRLWDMKVTVILIVIGALGRILKGLIKGLEVLEIRGQEETI